MVCLLSDLNQTLQSLLETRFYGIVSLRLGGLSGVTKTP